MQTYRSYASNNEYFIIPKFPYVHELLHLIGHTTCDLRIPRPTVGWMSLNLAILQLMHNCKGYAFLPEDSHLNALACPALPIYYDDVFMFNKLNAAFIVIALLLLFT